MAEEKKVGKEVENVVAASVVTPHSQTSGSDGSQPHIIIQNHPAGGVSRWFSWLGWVGLMFCIPIMASMFALYSDYFDTSGGLTEKYHSLSKSSKNKIALIRAEGTIMSSEGYISKQIQRVQKDDNVKAIVLRVNSPGGTVTASDNLYRQLKEMREDRDIPMVVSMGGIAASGGYYISMAVGDQEDCIFAEPTSTTGSIGVIIPHYNVSKLMERYDVVNDSIVSHPRKELLSMTKPPSEEDREILQNYVNVSFDRFKDIVRSGRKEYQEDPAALDVLATGEIFSGQQAVDNGLVDKIGYLDEVIERAVEMAGLDTDSARVVQYAGPVSLLDVVGVQSDQPADQQVLARVLQNVATPRAFYLFTSCAALTSSSR